MSYPGPMIRKMKPDPGPDGSQESGSIQAEKPYPWFVMMADIHPHIQFRKGADPG